jgi:ribose transport system ATP-binding protein
MTQSGADIIEQRDAVLAIKGLTKRFGGTAALQSVDFQVEPGQIHALLGANGAGKSTLIKILAGVHAPDAGEILINGKPFSDNSRRRIAFVHQDLALIESMTAGENMALAYGYASRWRFIDWKGVDAVAARALDLLGTPLPLDKPVALLSRAEKSIVAIARALVEEIDLLVLDEPTASLPEADVGRLFDILERLRQRKVSIIYVSHRLDEIFRIADAVTVLRDGRAIASYRPRDVTPDQLVADIVGKTLVTQDFVSHRQSGMVLEVSDLRVDHIGPIDFGVVKGEIVGLAGLRGQGQETIGRVLAGVIPRGSGSVRLAGREIAPASTADAIAAGIAFATSKRVEEALATVMTVKENLFLNPENFGRGSLQWRRRSAEHAEAANILARFDVRPADPEREITTLSGGNQQKVVLARWAGRNYKLLVLEEPTMGVDVGAKAEIYRMLAQDAEAGTSCIVISTDLDELAHICDRVLAFSRGRIVAELDRATLSVEALTRAVAGAQDTVAAGEEAATDAT